MTGLPTGSAPCAGAVQTPAMGGAWTDTCNNARINNLRAVLSATTAAACAVPASAAPSVTGGQPLWYTFQTIDISYDTVNIEEPIYLSLRTAGNSMMRIITQSAPGGGGATQTVSWAITDGSQSVGTGLMIVAAVNSIPSSLNVSTASSGLNITIARTSIGSVAVSLPNGTAATSVVAGDTVVAKWTALGTYCASTNVTPSVRRTGGGGGFSTVQTLSAVPASDGTVTVPLLRTITTNNYAVRLTYAGFATTDSGSFAIVTAPTPTASSSATASATASASATHSASATATCTGSVSSSPSNTPTPSPTVSESPSPTSSPSVTPRPSGVSASPSPDYQRALAALAAQRGPDTGVVVGAVVGSIVVLAGAAFAYHKWTQHKLTEARLRKLRTSAEFARSGADKLYHTPREGEAPPAGAAPSGPGVMVTYSLVGNLDALKSAKSGGPSSSLTGSSGAAAYRSAGAAAAASNGATAPRALSPNAGSSSHGRRGGR